MKDKSKMSNLLHQKKIGYFSKLVLLSNLFAILGLLISYSASSINPNLFWPIAFFGLAYLPLLLINVCFIFYWVLRKPKYSVLSILTILAGWPMFTQHMKLTFPTFLPKEKQKEEIRVMSYNVHLFKPIDDRKTEEFIDETIDLIKDIQPDIICFQEFYTKVKGQNLVSNKIKEEGEFLDYTFEAASDNKFEAYGQAIFSKFPIINTGSIPQYNYGINKIIYADLLKGQDTLRVYNVHLRSFALQSEDKKFIQNPATTNLEEKLTKRLSNKMRSAFNHRGQQAKALKKHIENTKWRSIVMGDFNDTPMSYAVNLIGKGMNNTFQKKGNGWGVTHFEMLPLFQIDYILVDKDLKVTNYEIIKKKLSDHYPIWADLVLP